MAVARGKLGSLHRQCPAEEVKPKHSAEGKSLGKDLLEGQGGILAPKSPLTWALLLPVPSWARCGHRLRPERVSILQGRGGIGLEQPPCSPQGE